MKKSVKILLLILFILLPTYSFAQGGFQMDTIKTSKGNLEITFIGHGTLMFSFEGKIIHVDPWTNFTDYKNMPKADIILITHEHFDHLDKKAIDTLKKDGTEILINEAGFKQIGEGIVMKNGDVKTVSGFKIEAVPAYNLASDTRFHPKGVGNGYIITFGDKKVYVAGDTENIPEIKALKGIDIAFLPMNRPYTMTPEMVADAAKAFRPEILYPYHYGETDTSKLVDLLKDEKDIEVRIREMK
ncbi:MAG: MBL fold metallo-hydrolase [Desulfobacteraceae bacterium]|jgi:L-ascorbate metabolism protein UlaG (beta-lactamase superfamily)